jgi:plastocyanin
MRSRTFLFSALAAWALAVPLLIGATVRQSVAADPLQITITLKDDTFTPAEVKIPAGQPFTLKFANQDAVAAEIEAKDLKIEQVVAGKGEIAVVVKAQPAGKYLFVNEYKEDTVKGYVVVE